MCKYCKIRKENGSYGEALGVDTYDLGIMGSGNSDLRIEVVHGSPSLVLAFGANGHFEDCRPITIMFCPICGRSLSNLDV